MYGALWRVLPGPAAAKIALSLLLVLGMAAVLWF
jgi:hypothetical protein